MYRSSFEEIPGNKPIVDLKEVTAVFVLLLVLAEAPRSIILFSPLS
jgi:hypothetical protein